MKIIKGISLFFVYPAVMLVLGFWCGVKTEQFFYPGDVAEVKMEQTPQTEVAESEQAKSFDEHLEVVTGRETLCADTVYVVEEVDVLKGTVVETIRSLPAQFLGMDRNQFMMAMENYQIAPPLMEQERGFESLEVLRFSRDQIKVRMNYKYVQPTQGFYLVAEDHEVVVYLDDMETVYINTGIMLDSLPEKMQLNIIQKYYVDGEGSLYSFLETYSS